MSRTERVSEHLNRALHAVFERDERLYLLGEDVADPYGGAFRVTRGLSTRYPGRVLATPISESGIMGVANGLALCGNPVIVEVMFGDFATLAFDQLVNFASKSVGMYGRRTPMPVLLRCPVGGNRGYGATHSQSPQKHFIGVPHLSLFELSPFHDAERMIGDALAAGEPAVLFEGKVLYGERTYRDGRVCEVLSYDLLGPDGNWARAHAATGGPRLAVIAAGSTANRALAAARTLIGEGVADVQVLVPGRLYPVDLAPVLDLLREADGVCVVEESTAGGTWGTEVARHIYERAWKHLSQPVRLVNSRDSVIPAAPHLEREVLVQTATIVAALREMAGSATVVRPPVRRHDQPADAASTGQVSTDGHEIAVPKLNNNDDTYIFLDWLLPDGGQVAAGDPVAEVETSKATEELVAEESGVLRQLVRAGTECQPGQLIGYLRSGAVGGTGSVPPPAAAPAAPAAASAHHVIDRSQRLVADVVTRSRREIPDAFVVVQVRLDGVCELQRRLADQPDGPVGMLEVVVKALAGLRPRHPVLFGSLIDTGTVQLAEEAHVGVTLDAGTGLFVPVVRRAESRSLFDVADELAGYRLKALRGGFKEDELTGANVAVSWNHEPDVVFVQPVIPPGVGCALSVGGPRTELRLTDTGDVVEATVCHLGLAHDHRFVNGREAVAFLHDLREILESAERLDQLATTA